MDASTTIEEGKRMKRILGGLSIVALALCGICGQSARADVVVQYDVSGTISTSGGDITFPQFNSSLGQLQFGDVAVDTLGEVTGTATFDIPACPMCPAGGFFTELEGQATDGVLGAQPVAITVPAVGDHDTEVVVTVPWIVDLPTGVFSDVLPFPDAIGTGTWNAPFGITISDTSCCGLPDYLTDFTVTPTISYTADVFYDYTPVPEPRLILPIALLLLALLAVRFSSRANQKTA
jgi:hypothetical protein